MKLTREEREALNIKAQKILDSVNNIEELEDKKYITARTIDGYQVTARTHNHSINICYLHNTGSEDRYLISKEPNFWEMYGPKDTASWYTEEKKFKAALIRLLKGTGDNKIEKLNINN